MNLTTPLLALLVANRSGDSAPDAAKAALMAAMIQPPMIGLLIAIMMAKQAAANVPSPAGKSTSTSVSNQGATLYNTVAPLGGHPIGFLPPFIGLTKKKALELAQLVRVDSVLNIIDAEDSSREHVTKQNPKAGTPWRDVQDLTLWIG